MQCRWVVAGFVLALLPGIASAQVEAGRAVISGTIRTESDSTPLSGIDVYIVGSRERTSTNKQGAFRFTGIYPGRYEVRARRLGYEQLVKFVTVAGGETNDNAWTMRIVPQQLSEVRVMGQLVQVPPSLRDPYRRAAQGFGDFILPADIALRKPFNTVDLLESIPGVQITDHLGMKGVVFARCNNEQNPFGPGNEKVQVYIDGNLATRTREVWEVLASVNPADIDMVEVYRGVARIPAEFLADACAVIAIWTKRT
jgi:hypothetical protein